MWFRKWLKHLFDSFRAGYKVVKRHRVFSYLKHCEKGRATSEKVHESKKMPAVNQCLHKSFLFSGTGKMGLKYWSSGGRAQMFKLCYANRNLVRSSHRAHPFQKLHSQFQNLSKSNVR